MGSKDAENAQADAVPELRTLGGMGEEMKKVIMFILTLILLPSILAAMIFTAVFEYLFSGDWDFYRRYWSTYIPWLKLK